MTITFMNKPLSLVGRDIKEGFFAPDFNITTKNLKEIRLSDFEKKIKLITTFVSLDTKVCDLQVKEFNKKVGSFSSKCVFLGISKDLPFAQTRFCENFSINNMQIFSDYKTSSFGINYGVLIKELNLLARSVIILDQDNVIRYLEIVKEITTSPDYDKAFKNLQKAVEKPSLGTKFVALHQCVPCEEKAFSLSREKIKKRLVNLKNWKFLDGKLQRIWKFKNFIDAKYFMDIISIISEEQGHHPNMLIEYNKLTVSLFTHNVGGLTENDFIMANIIDQLKVKNG